MYLRIFFTACIITGSALLLGCSTGPAPQPVDNDRLDSGEQTARQAGEAARESLADDGQVIYATSRDAGDDEQPDDRPDEQPDEQQAPTIEDAATIYVDGQGRYVDEQGDDVDLDDLQALSADPLQGRAIHVVITAEAHQLPVGELMPLFEALSDEGAFAEVSTGDSPIDDDDPATPTDDDDSQDQQE